MKKILSVAVLAAGLAGCAQLQAVGTGISLATASVTNPVTPAREAQIELAGDTILQAILAYRHACLAGAADKPCKANLRAIQPYTRQIPPLVAQLRSFVDANDQVNAVVVYNQLTTLYANVKTAAVSLGIAVAK